MTDKPKKKRRLEGRHPLRRSRCQTEYGEGVARACSYVAFIPVLCNVISELPNIKETGVNVQNRSPHSIREVPGKATRGLDALRHMVDVRLNPRRRLAFNTPTLLIDAIP